MPITLKLFIQSKYINEPEIFSEIWFAIEKSDNPAASLYSVYLQRDRLLVTTTGKLCFELCLH